jgi:hypothetical protein
MDVRQEVKQFAEEFAERLESGEFESTEKAQVALTEALDDLADRNWTDEDCISILQEAENPNAGFQELGLGVADFKSKFFPWREIALPAFTHEVKRELNELGVDLNNMVQSNPLASTVNTPQMDARVSAAFKDSKYADLLGEEDTMDTFYEHHTRKASRRISDIKEKSQMENTSVQLDPISSTRAQDALDGLTRPEVEQALAKLCGPQELAAITDIVNRLARALGQD